jgi:type I restriction-modification system DNA methylase subunit
VETVETKAFIKRLHELDRAKSTYEKFRDFCELAYCAYAKLTADPDRAESLETRYMQIVGTYQDKDTVRAYPELLAMAWDAVDGGQDFLGSVASILEVLDARNGQFMTPQSVSRMMAEMLLHDAGQIIEEKGYITLNEPAAGSGGMVLAAADVLTTQGFNPALNMLVQAIDISPLCFHMCYVQLTIREIPALVVRANTLSQEWFEAAWTPATMLFYEHHGHLFPQEREPEDKEPPPTPNPPERPRQLPLF